MGKVVRATKFILEDSQRRERAALTCSTEDRPVLTLYNETGVELLRLSEGADGTASLTISDKDGQPRIALFVKSNNPMFGLTDSSGNTRIVIGTNDDVPVISLKDRAGQQSTLSLAIDSKGQPRIVGKDSLGVKQFDT